MRAEPLGEGAFILRDLGPEPAYAVARRLSEAGARGLLEAVPSYETVGLYVDSAVFDLEEALRAATSSGPSEATRFGSHEIPVCYEMGEDFEDVCARLGLTPEEFIEAHSGTEYTCYAIGFAPGFPYLGYLPGPLSGVPRLETPRTRVPRGSVGITGNQTGIYPDELPGGWRLVGRTPLKIVDLDAEHFPIAPGNRVVFRPIDADEYKNMEGSRL